MQKRFSYYDRLSASEKATYRKTIAEVFAPSRGGGELHGLYTFSEKGETPTIEVWMRTAANARVLRCRTFLRTLIHEVLHHLDVTLFELDDSFHTELFRRESALVRKLAPPKENAPPRAPKTVEASPAREARQLDLSVAPMPTRPPVLRR